MVMHEIIDVIIFKHDIIICKFLLLHCNFVCFVNIDFHWLFDTISAAVISNTIFIVNQ